jgi:hypothetical protein
MRFKAENELCLSRRKSPHPTAWKRRKTLLRRAALLGMAAFAVPRSAQALSFNLTFDGTITGPNTTNIENATLYAAQQIENMISDPITVNVTVSAQATNSFLGEAVPFLNVFNYSTVRSDLLATSKTAVDSQAYSTLPASDPTGTNNYLVATAEQKALGMLPANDSASDGTFYFSTNFNYTYSSTGRAAGGLFDFIGVAEHELTHLLGRVSVDGGTLDGSPGYTPLDLFRYSGGSRALTTSASNPYFSIDGGTTNLKAYASSGDLADWAGGDNDSFNAGSGSSVENPMTPVDLAELDAMGYSVLASSRTLTWDGTNNSFNASHWNYSASPSTLYTTYIGANLVISAGGQCSYAPTTADTLNIDLSNTSFQGSSLAISNGTFLINNSGGLTGHTYYLQLDNGGSLSVTGTTTYGAGNNPISSPGNLTLDGGLIIGNVSGATAVATFSGGITQVGLTGGSNTPTDPTLYVGDSGNGTLNQSGTAYISTPTLAVAARTGSTGTYSMTGGVLKVGGTIYLGGTNNLSGGINPGGTAFFSTSGAAIVAASNLLTAGSGTAIIGGSSLSVASSLSVGSSFKLNITNGNLTAGGTTNNGTINQTGGSAMLGPVGGTGTLDVSGGAANAAGLNQSSVTVNSSGLLTLSGGSTNNVNSLSVSGSGKFDITNHHLFVDYGSGPDPIASIAAEISSGFNGGVWNGNGIFSTSAQSNAGSYGIGFADSADPGNPAGLASGQIEIAYTLLGDANLDFKVNGADFAILATNFNKAVVGPSGWDQGDFNYDGKINGADFAALAANFNQGAGQSAVSTADLAALNSFALVNGLSTTSVPEPAGVALTGLAFVSLLRRRRAGGRR